MTHPTSEPRLDEQALKACPHCGGAARMGYAIVGFYVGCWTRGCCGEGGNDGILCFDTEREAREAWNRRALPVPSGPSREEVEAAAKDLSALADKYVAWVKEQTGDTCETDDEGRHTNCHCKEMSFAGEMDDIAERLAMYRPAASPSETTGTGEVVAYPPRFKTQTVTGLVVGNCLAAAVASVIDCPLADLPDISDESTGGWWEKMATFCASRGYSFTQRDARKPPAGLSVAIGPSPRLPAPHAVVCFDGLPIFDPHPERTFFAGKEVEYFIAISPDLTAPPAGDGVPEVREEDIAWIRASARVWSLPRTDDGKLIVARLARIAAALSYCATRQGGK